MGIEIRKKVLEPEEIAARLNAIHDDVQAKFHDQWNWMDAYFHTEQLITLIRLRDERIANLEQALRQEQGFSAQLESNIKFLQSRVDGSEAELSRLRSQVEAMEDDRRRINDWCEAYPVGIFPEPDWERAKELLGSTLLSRVSAANMRHVVEGFKRYSASRQQAATEKEEGNGNRP